jgi:hypothetical protein
VGQRRRSPISNVLPQNSFRWSQNAGMTISRREALTLVQFNSLKNYHQRRWPFQSANAILT